MTMREEAIHNIFDAMWAIEDSKGNGKGLVATGWLNLELPITDDIETRRKVKEALRNLMDAYIR